MTIIDGSDLTTWSPFTTNNTYPGSPMDELDAVYGMLVYQNVDDQIVGNLAESLTTTDNVTWTLKLRPGLKFTDGTPFNADAVKYNYDWAANTQWGATSQAWISTWAPGIRSLPVLRYCPLRPSQAYLSLIWSRRFWESLSRE